MGQSPSDRLRDADTDEVRRVWNANAAFWDERMGEGNAFHRSLLLPALERLLALRPGEKVLEVACGNGQLARWMAARQVSVLAIDLSEEMIAIAKSRTRTSAKSIEFRVLDASDHGVLRELGTGAFDVVVCNMALMDMPTIDPLADALPNLLNPAGRFVFSVTHPCFNVSDMVRVARESEEGGSAHETRGIEIRRYLTPRKVRGIAMFGQPEPQPYFERPLSGLLGTFFRRGLLLDALEEPSFSASPEVSQPWFSWSRYSEIPPALVARLVRRPSRSEKVGRPAKARGARESFPASSDVVGSV